MKLNVTALRRFHLAMMAAWSLLVIPAILWWASSVPFLVFISIYANFTGHFSAWQGTRAEEAS